MGDVTPTHISIYRGKESHIQKSIHSSLLSLSFSSLPFLNWLVSLFPLTSIQRLPQELLSQKAAAGYRVVECEGEVGKSVVSAGDDFTVETALEDLEFGFSITTSTQKVTH